MIPAWLNLHSQVIPSAFKAIMTTTKIRIAQTRHSWGGWLNYAGMKLS
jgi:hypothetical protein